MRRVGIDLIVIAQRGKAQKDSQNIFHEKANDGINGWVASEGD